MSDAHRKWLRERAHKKLDEALNMYEQGHPLGIVSTFGWSVADPTRNLGFSHEARLRFTIEEST